MHGPAGLLLVFRAGGRIHVAAAEPARVMARRGVPMDGSRCVWWNSMSSLR